MKFIRNILDKQKKQFEKGGKLEKFYPAFEALDTFAFVPNHTAPAKGAHIRDGVDLKRMMMTVIIAMLPCLLFGIWNVGHQHFVANGQEADLWSKLLIGAQAVLPIVVVSYAVGLGIEFGFAVAKRHSVNEGYLVSGMLIALVMPPTVPLWQVALGTAFAVVLGKEVFGGTGMNVLNVAMTARAFLYFAYPSQLSGSVWTYNPPQGYSGATALAIAAETSKVHPNSADNTAIVQAFGEPFSFMKLFIGDIPGSIGETSTLMCLIGAAILIFTAVGSWKIIVSGFAGVYLTGLLLNALAVNEFMALPAQYHIVMGGVAFGIVFMATDPVTASQTETGKWIYGFLIGFFTVLIRVFNPAYPEGIMLAVLLMNIFAPLIDFYVIDANKKRRLKRFKYAV
ncbi:MAG: NADH:ubiquinone reductase (Na(+)-transporting) subunit B [Cytophagales bacterium]|nr:MAG: NADH:ubiquinone reductase (Na(+)-transporting) subunit B [Cytophagales bacterium]